MASSSTPSALHQPEPPSAPQIPVGNQMSTFDFDYSGACHHITDRRCRVEDLTKRKQLAGVSIPSAVRRPTQIQPSEHHGSRRPPKIRRPPTHLRRRAAPSDDAVQQFVQHPFNRRSRRQAKEAIVISMANRMRLMRPKSKQNSAD
ncbi:hypothetical protein ACLOJK_039243 [Asimina triloba]